MPDPFSIKYKQGFIANQIGRDKPGLVPRAKPLAELHRKRIGMNGVEEHTPETIFCKNAPKEIRNDVKQIEFHRVVQGSVPYLLHRARLLVFVARNAVFPVRERPPNSPDYAPRGKCIIHIPQCRPQLRVVPQQNASHIVVVDPVHSLLGINLRAEISRKVAVALKSPRRHEDKDTECRIAEPKSLRQILSEHANHQIKAVYVASVDLPELLGPNTVGRNFLEGFHGLFMNQTKKLVVAWDPAFALAHDIDRSQIAVYLVPLRVLDVIILLIPQWEFPQEARVVMQRNRAGMRNSKRIEYIPHRGAIVQECLCVFERHLRNVQVFDMRSVRGPVKRQLLRDQRVQAVNRDELFCNCK